MNLYKHEFLYFIYYRTIPSVVPVPKLPLAQNFMHLFYQIEPLQSVERVRTSSNSAVLANIIVITETSK